MSSSRQLAKAVAVFCCVASVILDAEPVMGQVLPGAMFYWQADGTPRDSAGSNNGNLFGGATYGPSPTGQAFDLTGSGDRVFMDQPFPLVNVGDDFTVSLWMNMTIPPIDFGSLFETRDFGPYGFDLGVNPDGSQWIAGRCDDSDSSFYCSGPPTALGEWHHVAAVLDWGAGKVQLYVNGDAAESFSMEGCSGFTHSDRIYLGAAFDAFPGWEFTGFIDEIQVYGRALSKAEIGLLYGGFPVSVSPPPVVPVAHRLYPATPNPFNASTTIRFDLPAAGPVSLKVYDLAGHQVRTLKSEIMGAEGHEVIWRGRDDQGSQVASGVYLYRLRAGSFVATRRMVLLK